LPQILERVERGDEVTLTRHGVPVAVIVRPDRLKTRRAQKAMEVASEVRKVLERGRKTELRENGTISEARAEELIGGMRESRDSR
jgi:prevent-host-death family protein